jgi:hypothetical protein
MSLRDTLTALRAALVPGGEPGALDAAAVYVNASARLDAAGHLQIYRRAVLGTLERALGDIHPVCRRLTGAEFFAAMARAYARRHPSRSADLADYGAGFAGFIATFAPAATLPYLADVARLEWCWHRAFHAADSAPLDRAALAAIAPELTPRLGFALPASAHLLESPWPIDRIWAANQPDATADGVSLDAGPAQVIVWRQGLQMRIDPLDPAEWALLRALAAGACLDESPAPEALPTLLPRCVSRGWLVAFSLRAPQDFLSPR